MSSLDAFESHVTPPATSPNSRASEDVSTLASNGRNTSFKKGKEETPIVQVENLVKEYDNGVRAVNGVTFQVRQGEVVVIIGPSGCGKSTLLRTLNGLETIQEGRISFRGETIPSQQWPWHMLRQKIGMVFQSYELFPHLTVMENLLLGPTVVQRVSKEVAARKAAGLLKRVGLLNRANSYPRQLSGGQKQRVAIVRALMMDPEVLLLDEVTASLDPEMVREVLDVVLELAGDGMTMVIVTHEMSFARAISDRLIFMDAGKIVEEADPQVFFDAPRTERARKFLDIFSYDNRDAGR